MPIFFNRQFNVKAAILVFFILFLSIGVFVVGFCLINNYLVGPREPAVSYPPFGEEIPEITVGLAMKKFTSAEEFKVFLEERQAVISDSYGVRSMVAPTAAMDVTTEDLGLTYGKNTGLSSEESGVARQGELDRVSETNVQTTGVDEPDIVKTDGQNIFLSSLVWLYRAKPMSSASAGARDSSGVSVSIAPDEFYPDPYYAEPDTKIIEARPVDALSITATIPHGGDLLLDKNNLVVLNLENKIIGFDVSDRTNPVETWRMSLSDRSQLADARLKDGSVYLLVVERANYGQPCPVKPLMMGDTAVEISCTDIYYPTVETEVDSVYSLVAVDIATGEVKNKISFVGAYNLSGALYMSSDNAYISYNYSGDIISFVYKFFLENRDIVPAWVIEKMEKLSGYDISNNSKMSELNVIMGRWQNSVSDDEMLVLENELVNRGEGYYLKHRRELNFTGIVKVSLSDLSITATGAVPGYPLNQFSFDEYEGNLRVATTIGQQGFWLAGGLLNSRNHTVSDVYVLDDNLKIVGRVADLGETEKIYAVRFIANRGYVVTFRQIDPFYVLDLNNPRAPALRGELKIPGYSSYLHPLSTDKILGIGQDNSRVKLSIFDVSRPDDPQETSQYSLNEYYSEALNNHHAFLLDDKHKIFFMPGSQGGYVFAYENGLSLKTAIKEDQIQRAIYINDYLYLIGREKIVVLDEKSWERVGELSLD